MHWIIPAISIDCGFKFAVALILFVRYFETKDKVIFWWSMGWLFFGLHNTIELSILDRNLEWLWFFKHTVWAFTAVAFLESMVYMKRPNLKIWHIASALVGIGAIVSSYVGVFLIKEWYAATIPTSFLNGLGFIACAFYFLKITKEKKSAARLPIFLGFFLNGVHNLDYPFLRPLAWFAPIGFSLGVVFAIIFAIGLIMLSTEELKRQREESQKFARDLFALNAINTIVGRSLNLEKILNDVLDKVVDLIKMEMAGVMLLDRENKCLSLTVCRGFSKEFIQTLKRTKLDEKTFIGQIVHAGKAVYAAEATEEATILKRALEKEGIHSFIGIPLKSKDKNLGIMILASCGYKPFSESESQLLTSVGSTVGVAIENSKLYEKVKKWSRELEKIIDERTKDLTNARRATLNILEDVNEACRELKETQAQLVLRERLAAIGQMASAIAHELRNPLTNIKMSTYYLNEKLAESTPELTKIIQNIDKEIDRTSGTITNILEFSRPPKPVLSLTDINILLEETLNSAKEKDWLKGIEITKKFDFSIPKVSLDSFRLKQTFDNIILNASQAMSKGGKLTVQTQVVNNKLEVRITDTGVGIAKENLERIFEPFFTDKHKGTGLGLAVASEVIRSHQGSIQAESELGRGSTFIIRLPL